MARLQAVALLALALLAGRATAQIEVDATTELPGAGRYTGELDPSPAVPVVWEQLGSFPLVGIHMSNLPGTNKYLFIMRGSGEQLARPELDVNVGEVDIVTQAWRNVSSTSNAFCGGMVTTDDGKLVAVGGHASTRSGKERGINRVRVYDPSVPSLPDTTTMHQNRWYPSATLLPNGKILILGGTVQANEDADAAPSLEIWDPTTPETQPVEIDLDPEHFRLAGKHYYPFTYVLPTGDTLTTIDKYSWLLKQDGSYVLDPATGQPLRAPDIPDPDLATQFPKSGTSVMTALDPANNYTSVGILVFGGQKASYECPHVQDEATTALAKRSTWRMTVSWTFTADGTPSYSFSNWAEEDSGLHRCGGDAVLLPGGDVILVNGVQTGCMGGTVGAINRANYPTLWPQLYQPDRPLGQRHTILQASPIARIYHDTAGLTRDGNVLVAGCDACSPNQWLLPSADFWDPSPTRRWERRVEVMHPPYSLDDAAAPAWVSWARTDIPEDGDIVLNATYNSVVLIEWGAAVGSASRRVPVTGVALVAPTTVTHGFNTHQRVVWLPVLRTDEAARTLMVRTPPNINVAPPGYYMAFLLNGKTHSKKAPWVRLLRPGTATEGGDAATRGTA